MTSRREFFGLLAAAPLVAPAVVREFATPKYASGGYIRSIGGTPLTEFLDYSRGVTGEVQAHFGMTPEQFQTFKDVLDAPPEPKETLRALMRGTSPWDIPNRLYGTQINADGEAV